MFQNGRASGRLSNQIPKKLAITTLSLACEQSVRFVLDP